MITPTSVEPYMLHGVTPKVFSTHSRVRESIGSPVNESFSTPSRAPPPSPEARSMRKTVGAAARVGTRNSPSASSRRPAWDLPQQAPPATPPAEDAHAWKNLLPALGVARDEQQTGLAVVHAEPDAVGAEEREERNRDSAALHSPEDGTVKGERGIEHHGHAVALRDAFGFEEVGEAGGPGGEILEAPRLGAAVGALQAKRGSLPAPAVHALMGEVEALGIAVEEVPERAPAEGLNRLRIAPDVEDSRHDSVVTSRSPGGQPRRRASRPA